MITIAVSNNRKHSKELIKKLKSKFGVEFFSMELGDDFPEESNVACLYDEDVIFWEEQGDMDIEIGNYIGAFLDWKEVE